MKKLSTIVIFGSIIFKSVIFKFIFLFLYSIFFLISVIQSNVYDEIIMTIDNQVITRNEVALFILQQKMRRPNQTITDKKLQQMQQQALETLTQNALLDIQANELNIQISEEILDAEIERYKEMNRLTDTAFEEFLSAQKLSIADFRFMILSQMRRQRVLSKEIHSKINITEKELLEKYEKEGDFSLKIKARHILRKVKKTDSIDKREKAKNEIIYIKDQILNKDKSFTKMADEYSQDPSVVNNHGLLPEFNPDDMVKEFGLATKTLPIGTLSEPIQTQFGYHLIEVISRSKVSKKEFETVKNSLTQTLRKEKFEFLFKTYMDKLKQQASIQNINPL